MTNILLPILILGYCIRSLITLKIYYNSNNENREIDMSDARNDFVCKRELNTY